MIIYSTRGGFVIRNPNISLRDCTLSSASPFPPEGAETKKEPVPLWKAFIKMGMKRYKVDNPITGERRFYWATSRKNARFQINQRK